MWPFKKNTTPGPWPVMFGMVWRALPEWVIERFDKRRTHDQNVLAILISLAIVLLSITSIGNLSQESHKYHSGFFSYLTGAGIAVLVPLAVIGAMFIDKGRWIFWTSGIIFAAVSGMIQFNLYNVGTTTTQWMVAVAFGFGIPFSEILLAYMESLIIQQHQGRVERTRHAAILSEAQRLAAEKQALIDASNAVIDEKRRIDDEALRHAQDNANIARSNEVANAQVSFQIAKMNQELHLQKEAAEQKRQLEADRAAANIRIRENKSATRVTAVAMRGVAGGVASATPPATPPATNASAQKKRDGQINLINLYKENPNLPQIEAARKLGVDKSTVSRYLDALERLDVLHKEFDPVGGTFTVTVNGNEQDFLNGVI